MVVSRVPLAWRERAATVAFGERATHHYPKSSLVIMEGERERLISEKLKERNPLER